MTLIDALQNQVDKNRDGVAFISGDTVWSCHRLAEDAERLASALIARVGAEEQPVLPPVL